MELETHPHKDIFVEFIKNQDYKEGNQYASLKRSAKGWTLESIGSLDLRKSALEDDFEEEEEKDEEDELNADLDAGAHERDFITVDEVPQRKEIGIENATVTGIAIATEKADEGRERDRRDGSMAGGGTIQGAGVGVGTARIVIVMESIIRGMPAAVPALEG
ncbi:unnamed protein product [Camellia sinensis]